MSKEKVEFNLNNKMLVKLKEEGFKFWLYDFNRHLPDHLKLSIKELKSKQDKDGYVEFQAWEFIRIFGPTISAAFSPIFETNVRFYKEELK